LASKQIKQMRRRPSKEDHRQNGQIARDRLLPADRRRAFDHLVAMRAKLGGHGHDSKRHHPNHDDRREGDGQGAHVPMVDEAFIVKA
jgi:hypothetical protein